VNEVRNTERKAESAVGRVTGVGLLLRGGTDRGKAQHIHRKISTEKSSSSPTTKKPEIKKKSKRTMRKKGRLARNHTT